MLPDRSDKCECFRGLDVLLASPLPRKRIIDYRRIGRFLPRPHSCGDLGTELPGIHIAPQPTCV